MLAATVRQAAQVVVEQSLHELDESYRLMDEIAPPSESFALKTGDRPLPSHRWNQLMTELFGYSQTSLLIRKLPSQRDTVNRCKKCTAREIETVKHIIATVNSYLNAEMDRLGERMDDEGSRIEYFEEVRMTLMTVARQFRRTVIEWTWPTVPYRAERVYKEYFVVVRADGVRVGDRINIVDWLETFGSADNLAYAKSYTSWPTVITAEQTSVAVDLEVAWPMGDDDYQIVRWLPKIAFDWCFNAVRRDVMRSVELPPFWM